MEYVDKAAEISPCGQYRYSLMRRFTYQGTGTILFVGLNPSTADALIDDPTIRRETDFAKRWGYDIYLKGNLYAYRSTKPAKLSTVPDPIGGLNCDRLMRMIGDARVVVACWGQHKLSPGAAALARAVLGMKHTRCFGFNKNGSPVHPLFLPKSSILIPVRR
jgi:hypothetical protein